MMCGGCQPVASLNPNELKFFEGLSKRGKNCPSRRRFPLFGIHTNEFSFGCSVGKTL